MNYLCIHQDELQDLQWLGHAHVTIHPIVCFYNHNCNACRNVIVLSDELVHEVRTYEKKEVELLEQERCSNRNTYEVHRWLFITIQVLQGF